MDQIEIEIIVSVGRAKSQIRDFISLQSNSLITLDRQISDPVEILVGDRLIARGQLQISEEGSGNLVVKLTEILNVSGG